jgi:hypothetical protein
LNLGDKSFLNVIGDGEAEALSCFDGLAHSGDTLEEELREEPI